MRMSLSLKQPWGLALQNLLQDKLRFALSIVGVALGVMLILFLLGLRAGFFRNARIYLENAPGSVVVLPTGVKNTSVPTSQLLPPDAKAEVSAALGVVRVTPVLLMMAIPELHGKKQVIKLVGYEAALGGGPWDLSEGREPQADDEVVLDRAIASRHGFSVGDTFDIAGHQLKVVGLSGGTSSVAGSYVFASKTFIESLLLAPGASSVLLVTPAAGTSPAELVASLRSIPGTNVLLKRDVMANDQQVVAGIFDQVIFPMVAAAFVVGALVVAMIIYTATNERRGEYGIIKALGARSSVLYRVVALQALAASGMGSVVGLAFAYVLGSLVTALKPEFLVVITPSAIAVTVGAGFVMALLGALFPARAVAGMAPAEVFRR